MVAQYLFQRIVEQVRSGMVGGRSVTLVGIHTCHELRSGVFRQLLDDMYALVVLTLGVDNLDGLILVAEHTAVTDLSTHLAIERSGVENQLIELVLLLGYLAVAQDMTVVFGIVVAHELLFASLQLRPVAVLHSSGIAGALLLFLHLHVKLLLVNGEVVLTADQLSEVEGESVSVEQTESLYAIQLVLTFSLQLLHCIVQHGDTLVEGTQERLLLLFYDLGDQCLLCLQLWEGITHLMNEGGNELIDEPVLLTEEGIGIADGTAQDAADHITRLGI